MTWDQYERLIEEEEFMRICCNYPEWFADIQLYGQSVVESYFSLGSFHDF